MQRSRDQFFAGAALAQDANPGLSRSHALNLRQHALHRFTGEHHLVLAQLLPQLAVLFFQALEPQRVFDGEEELVGRDRFFQKINRTQPGGAHRHGDVGLARHHHHRSIHAQRPELFKEGQPVFAGHDHVRKDQVKLLFLPAQHLEGAHGAVADGSLVARKAEGAGERGQGVGIIIDDEQAGFHAS